MKLFERHTHADRLERWFGTEHVERISASMRDWYGPPIPLLGVPGGALSGGIRVTRGGEFVGPLSVGGFANVQDFLEQRTRAAVRRWGAKQARTANAGFTSWGDLISEATAGKSRLFIYNKVGTTGVVAATNSLWRVGAQPVAGAAAGAAPGGTVPDDSTQGAFTFVNPSGGDTQHLVRGYVTPTVGGQTLMVYDRIFAVAKCVDPDTECLTRNGWTSYANLRVGDEILAYDKDAHVTRWEPVQEVFVNEHYSGPMVHFNGAAMHALTTPDHRWPVQNMSRGGGFGPLRTVLTKDLKWGQYIPRAAPHETSVEATVPDTLVELIAWYYTEGSFVRGRKNITICQSQTMSAHYCDQINDLLARHGAQDTTGRRGNHRHTAPLRYSTFVDKRGLRVWTLSGPDVDQIKHFTNHEKKTPTMQFLLLLTPEQLDLFVQRSLDGDGSRRPNHASFSQTNRGRMEAFVTAATLAGYSPKMSADGHRCTLVGLAKGRGNVRSAVQQLHPETISYNGTIWCPRVPSTFWVARRHGAVFMTGNTMNSTANETVTGVPTRYASTTSSNADYAAGNFLFIECGSALAATAHNWDNCTYTDQDGNAATLPTVTGNSGCIANRIDHPTGQWFAPLASGDTGIAALTLMHCSAAVATGTIDFVMGHPLGILPAPVANLMVPFDYIALPRVFDNACIALLEMTKPATTATTYNVNLETVAG